MFGSGFTRRPVRPRTLARVVSVVTLLAAPLAISTWAEATPTPTPAAAPVSCAPAAARPSAVAVGIQWAVRTTGACASPTAGARTAGGGTPPSPSFRGSPPLRFHSGPVTGTTKPGELTVTPVYWVPTGSSLTIPAQYKTLLNRFVADVAHDSNKATNVFSALKQYTNSGGAKLHYLIHAGTPIVDTDAFPAGGCTADTGAIYSDNTHYSVCITNSQLLHEASVFTTAHGLPNTDLAHLYVYYMPKGVETCFTRDERRARRHLQHQRQRGLLRVPRVQRTPARRQPELRGSGLPARLDVQLRRGIEHRREPVTEREHRRRHRDQYLEPRAQRDDHRSRRLGLVRLVRERERRRLRVHLRRQQLVRRCGRRALQPDDQRPPLLRPGRAQQRRLRREQRRSRASRARTPCR